MSTGRAFYWQWKLWLESLLNLETDDYWELESEFYECFVGLSFNDYQGSIP